MNTLPAPEAQFDLIVIGAGINGAGIARDAANRGLKVALVEREDIGSGTSNYSGRLVHGGLRYLEQGDVALVRESLREREILFQLAPHLVKPVPLMMPFYSRNKRSSWTVRLGMLAYDILSFDKSTAWHFTLSREKTLQRFKGMNAEGLNGSAIFMDGQVVWSERLCTEVVIAAHQDGARIFTYAEVDGFLEDGGKVAGVRYTDRLTGERHALGAKIVVNAAGPWVDTVLSHGRKTNQRFIGGTKGSHLVVKPFKGAPTDVVYYEAFSDGRLVLVIPWGDDYMIGTTDRRFDGQPENAVADASEVDYLLGEVNRLIPEANLTEADIAYTYSGIRPLPYSPDKSEWNVSRSHVIHDHGGAQDGLFSIIGGKLTTYRSLAEETVDTVYKKLGQTAPRCRTRKLAFPGAAKVDVAALVRNNGVSEAVAKRLVRIYGSRALEVTATALGDATLLEPLDAETGLIGAELMFAFKHEFARTLNDALLRRTMVGYNNEVSGPVVERAADLVAKHLGWDRVRRDAELARHRRYCERYANPARAPSHQSKRVG
jgi:glycerol-3-phosphate dehydrogenase